MINPDAMAKFEMRFKMRVGGGYDPFWGPDPFRYIERDKLVWEKPRKAAVTPEDEEKFYGNVLKVAKPAVEEPTFRKRVDFKV